MRTNARLNRTISRRRALQLGALGLAVSTLGLADALAIRPERIAHAAPAELPNIQHDIDGYIAPARSIDGTLFRFGPVFTLFVTARLTRTPDERDQQALAAALAAIEDYYPFSPGGVFTTVAYGIPYFDRLPGGMQGALVAQHMPRLLADRRRYALEEATPAPTDVSPLNPDVVKARFHVPVAIESNDLLLTLRSDRSDNLADVIAWLTGSGRLAGTALPSPPLEGLVEVTSARSMFVQPGLPRRLAEERGLPFASREHPDSPIWMGFASQQADASGPAAITTFQGNRSASFTDTRDGDYFVDGSLQHLSHIILDLEQWYAEPYSERVQLMFRSNPTPAAGNVDQFTDGGGPAYLPNVFQGRDDARRNAEGVNTTGGERRIGHVTAIQRSSRAADGTPVHIRADGAGLDSMDVPDGSDQPKLHFSIFVPTASFFARMRRYQAAQDLAGAHSVPPRAVGLERFFTTTRQQNFLVPPRRHRAFPLLELT